MGDYTFFRGPVEVETAVGAVRTPLANAVMRRQYTTVTTLRRSLVILSVKEDYEGS